MTTSDALILGLSRKDYRFTDDSIEQDKIASRKSGIKYKMDGSRKEVLFYKRLLSSAKRFFLLLKLQIRASVCE